MDSTTTEPTLSADDLDGLPPGSWVVDRSGYVYTSRGAGRWECRQADSEVLLEVGTSAGVARGVVVEVDGEPVADWLAERDRLEELDGAPVDERPTLLAELAAERQNRKELGELLAEQETELEELRVELRRARTKRSEAEKLVEDWRRVADRHRARVRELEERVEVLRPKADTLEDVRALLERSSS